MPPVKLVRMVVANTLRSPRHFAVSTFGIVIGISLFVLLMAFTARVRTVLGTAFPVEQIEVVAPRATLLGKDVSKKLDDQIVQAIRARPEVADAVPRMAIAFPATGSGSFEGQSVSFEVTGDGIDPASVIDDAKVRELFKDWDELEPDRAACVPPRFAAQEAPPVDPAALGAVDPSSPVGAAAAGAATPAPLPLPPPRPKRPGNPCAHPERYYCDEHDRTCHHRVPVIVSPVLLELYNSQFANSHGLPVIGELEQMVVQRGLGRMRFEMGLGDTMVAGSNVDIPFERRRRVEGVLVGINPKAMQIGMTLPIGYVRRWNKEYAGDQAASTYSSIMVTLRDKGQVAPFAQWVKDGLDLRLKDSQAERLGTLVFVVTLIFGFITIVIVVISAINIAHNFFMQVSDRRREIGVLRAVGATRLDVRLVILGEAGLIGLIGGGLGVGLAFLASLLIDWWFRTGVSRFPFKPDKLFAFEPSIILAGLGLSVIFCVLGGFLPARKASRLEPAQALAAQ